MSDPEIWDRFSYMTDFEDVLYVLYESMIFDIPIEYWLFELPENWSEA